LVTGWPIS